jgi:hypothetical protein
MNDLNLAWLIPTLMQTGGLAIALGVLGFSYERAMQDRKPFWGLLVHGAGAGWLALAGVIFALGVGFTQAPWIIKVMVILLAIVLVGLAVKALALWKVDRSRVSKPRRTARSIGLFLAKIWLGILFTLLVAWAIHLGWHAYHLYGLARSLEGELSQLKVQDMLPMVGAAAEDVRSIDGELRPLFPVFNALHSLPGIGPYLGQIDPLLSYADGLTQAGDEIVKGLEPLLVANNDAEESLSLMEHTNLVLHANQEYFRAALQEIELANTARGKVNTERLPTAMRALFMRLDEQFDLLQAGGQFLLAAPALLGSGQQQNYLILAQNRDELRATGGFISGIGLVSLQDGKIQQFSLADSYAVDDFSKPYPNPPEALQRFMLADYWVARDANWSPDFPTSARQAQQLYTLSTGIETQGVIAFNQIAIQRILEAIGPLQVPGTDEPVSAQNVENYMRQAWAPEAQQGLSQEWWAHRKDFMQLLGNAIIEKSLSIKEEAQLVNLVKVGLDLLGKKQLLVYFNQPAAQAALVTSGWDGALRPESGDYLYLVDSNVGFNKMDAMVQRWLAYQVDLTDVQHPVGQAALVYQNAGVGNVACQQVASYGTGTYQDMQQRCYWDYWRVYTPPGSGITSSTVQPVAAGELLNGEGWPGQVESLAGEGNTQVYAGLLVLPLDTSTQFDLAYSLPASILRTKGAGLLEYVLRVDVQPGLAGLPFRFEISLPESAQVSSASDGLTPSGTHSWVWQGELEKSIVLNLTFSQSHESGR